jgi:hypothetical protein
MAPKRKDDKYVDAGDSLNWHPEQEKVLLELLSEYDLMPMDGKGDGQMERKLEAVWKPLLPLFIEKNTALCKHLSCNICDSICILRQDISPRWVYI